MKARSPHSNGFSLVEIIIVLAIGGLIISMVFLATSQVSMANRDHAREAYLAQIATNLERYKESASHSYRYPKDQAEFEDHFTPSGATRDYVVDGTDPLSNTPYQFDVTPPGPNYVPTSTSSAIITYVAGSNCAKVATGPKQLYKLFISLERGDPAYCLDND